MERKHLSERSNPACEGSINRRNGMIEINPDMHKTHTKEQLQDCPQELKTEIRYISMPIKKQYIENPVSPDYLSRGIKLVPNPNPLPPKTNFKLKSNQINLNSSHSYNLISVSQPVKLHDTNSPNSQQTPLVISDSNQDLGKVSVKSTLPQILENGKRMPIRLYPFSSKLLDHKLMLNAKHIRGTFNNSSNESTIEHSLQLAGTQDTKKLPVSQSSLPKPIIISSKNNLDTTVDHTEKLCSRRNFLGLNNPTEFDIVEGIVPKKITNRNLKPIKKDRYMTKGVDLYVKNKIYYKGKPCGTKPISQSLPYSENTQENLKSTDPATKNNNSKGKKMKDAETQTEIFAQLIGDNKLYKLYKGADATTFIPKQVPVHTMVDDNTAKMGLNSTSTGISETTVVNPTKLWSAQETFEHNSVFDQPMCTKMRIDQPPVTSVPDTLASDSLQFSDSVTQMLEQITRDIRLCLCEDNKGNTPLHTAVLDNNHFCLRSQCIILKSINSHLNHINFAGETALMLAVKIAASTNSFDTVITLLTENADPTIEDHDGMTPLHYAVYRGCMPLVKILLDAKGSHLVLNRYSYDGFAPIHLAAIENHGSIIELLVQRGADINLKDRKSGRTAFFHAAERQNTNAAIVLRKFKASITVPNFVGQPPPTLLPAQIWTETKQDFSSNLQNLLVFLNTPKTHPEGKKLETNASSKNSIQLNENDKEESYNEPVTYIPDKSTPLGINDSNLRTDRTPVFMEESSTESFSNISSLINNGNKTYIPPLLVNQPAGNSDNSILQVPEPPSDHKPSVTLVNSLLETSANRPKEPNEQFPGNKIGPSLNNKSIVLNFNPANVRNVGNNTIKPGILFLDEPTKILPKPSVMLNKDRPDCISGTQTNETIALGSIRGGQNNPNSLIKTCNKQILGNNSQDTCLRNVLHNGQVAHKCSNESSKDCIPSTDNLSSNYNDENKVQKSDWGNNQLSLTLTSEDNISNSNDITDIPNDNIATNAIVTLVEEIQNSKIRDQDDKSNNHKMANSEVVESRFDGENNSYRENIVCKVAHNKDIGPKLSSEETSKYISLKTNLVRAEQGGTRAAGSEVINTEPHHSPTKYELKLPFQNNDNSKMSTPLSNTFEQNKTKIFDKNIPKCSQQKGKKNESQITPNNVCSKNEESKKVNLSESRSSISLAQTKKNKSNISRNGESVTEIRICDGIVSGNVSKGCISGIEGDSEDIVNDLEDVTEFGPATETNVTDPPKNGPKVKNKPKPSSDKRNKSWDGLNMSLEALYNVIGVNIDNSKRSPNSIISIGNEKSSPYKRQISDYTPVTVDFREIVSTYKKRKRQSLPINIEQISTRSKSNIHTVTERKICLDLKQQKVTRAKSNSAAGYPKIQDKKTNGGKRQAKRKSSVKGEEVPTKRSLVQCDTKTSSLKSKKGPEPKSFIDALTPAITPASIKKSERVRKPRQILDL